MAERKYSMSEALDINAKSNPKQGPKVLRSIEVERGANGGFIATHRFKSDGPHYHESEQHIFGAEDGAKLHAHLGKHLGITGDEDGDNEKGESAEHKARSSGSTRPAVLRPGRHIERVSRAMVAANQV